MTDTNKWTTKKLKFLFSSRMGGAWGDEPIESNSIVCLRAADFETEKIRHKVTDLTRRSFKKDEIINKGLKEGDLIIEKSGGGENQPVGRIIRFSLDEPALCSNFLEVLRPNKNELFPEFGAYKLYSLWISRLTTLSIKQTTGIQNLDISDYLENKVFIPSMELQISIAKFLNKEIDYIDNLIQAKENQLNLLSEKRQVLVLQVITHGLNSIVNMKDSGIEWLGKIPKHWELKKIKYLSNLKSGDFITSESIKESDTYPVYGGNGLRGFTSSNTHSGEYVLIGRQGALCGNVNYASGDFFASEHAIVCIPIAKYNTYWFGELLRIMNLNQYSAAAAQSGLSVEVIKNLSIPVPPVEEQKEIEKFIKSETGKIDSLKNVTERSIELLRERRTALITAAVTGQIEI
jgi:type I restriction enzyme S subunit